MELTDEQIKELDKKLHKLKLYLIKNTDVRVWISRRGNSVILDCKISE